MHGLLLHCYFLIDDRSSIERLEFETLKGLAYYYILQEAILVLSDFN